MARNQNFEDMMEANAMPRQPKASPKKLKHLEVIPAHLSKVHDADGEPMHVVEHHFHNDGPGTYRQPEAHHFGKDEEGKLMEHLSEHIHIKGGVSGGEENEEHGESTAKVLEGGAAGAAY